MAKKLKNKGRKITFTPRQGNEYQDYKLNKDRVLPVQGSEFNPSTTCQVAALPSMAIQ